ncbi:glycosyl transferase group 1, partial [mine drainage metagenome]
TGTYNLGFVAVSRAAGPFLAWWQVRLRRDAIVDPRAMLFTDQRWVDLAPGYFPVHILRDPGCNVAYWNLGTRTIAWSGGAYTVNGHPLRFLHFSGYDPDRPHLLSRHQGERPRVLLSERPLLRSLCDRYRGRLLLAGWGDPDLPAYGYGRVPDGPAIDRLMRRCYRRALLASEADGRPE